MSPPPQPQQNTGRRRLLRIARVTALWLALAAGCALVLAVSAGLGGPFGLVLAADCLAGAALLMLVAKSPDVGRGELARSLGAVANQVRQRLPAGRRSTGNAAQFPAFLKISSDLGWATTSMWHYDHGARPLLTRVMQAALAERHRLDAATEPARAKELVGEDVWPFLDPTMPTSRDSRAPGPDVPTLSRIIDRLERL
jgi:hypothetical protein